MFMTPYGPSYPEVPGGILSALIGGRGGSSFDPSVGNYYNMLASIINGQQAASTANRATDAGLLGGAYNAQAGLLGSQFGNLAQLQGSQFGNLAGLQGGMYGAKQNTIGQLGTAAAGRDASMYGNQANLMGQGLNSQANVVNSLAGLNASLANTYGGLDSQRMQNEQQLNMLRATSPLLGALVGRSSGGGGFGGGMGGMKTNYGAGFSLPR